MTRMDAPLGDLLRIFGERFSEERCVQIASSLTFTALLALVPIFTVTLTVVTAFPVFHPLLSQLQNFVLNNMVPESVAAITLYAEQFSSNATRLTTLGIALLMVTALLLMFTIERAFNDIWRVKWRRPLLHRILVYWTALTVGPLFVGASLSLTSYVISLSLGMVGETPAVSLFMFKLVPLVLTSTAFALLYFTVPNRLVRKRDALLGGVAAGVCFEAMKLGFGYYISHFPTYRLVYGAFATVPIFLLWIYLSWLVVIGGAVLTAVLPELRERAGQARPVPGSDFFDALQVLKALWRAQRSGAVVSLSQLHQVVKVRLDHLETLLGMLASTSWVARSGPSGWLLSRDPATIKVEDIYHLFVFHSEARSPARHADARLEALAHDVSARAAGGMQMSLAQLFDESEPAAAVIDAPARIKAV